MFPAIIKKDSKKKFLSKKNLIKIVSVFLFASTVGVSVYFYNNLFNSDKNNASASTISSSFFSTANLELTKDGDIPFSTAPSIPGDPTQDQAGIDSSPNNGVVREGDTFIYTYNMSPEVELTDVRFTDFLPANTTNIQYSSSSTLISNTICQTGSTISSNANISKIDCIIGNMLPGQTYMSSLARQGYCQHS